jgi:hypothetical protein
MNFKTSISILIYFSYAASIYAGSVMSEIPSNPDASEKYVFYLHGSAEEQDGSSEKYDAAVEAIAEGADNVISEVRGDTDPNSYAEKIKKQVNLLLSKGVPAKNITISGFSKGSIIALAVAITINNSKINYVLLAGCSEDLNGKYSVDPTKAAGRILSIYDSGDEKFESCDGTIKPSAKVIFEETDLDSGKGHKIFRIPKEKFIEQWRDPLIEWING